jgi:recombinational DNA repair ATPase RecF
MSEHGKTPVLLIDDLASEFDHYHLTKMIELLASTRAQIWLTGVDNSLIKSTKNVGLDPLVFHVKHGQVTLA